jgi:hypothetical protein
MLMAFECFCWTASLAGDASSSAVVSLDGSGWLKVTKLLFQCNTDGAGFFVIVEESCQFSFGSNGDKLAHDLAEYINDIIGGCRGR